MKNFSLLVTSFFILFLNAPILAQEEDQQQSEEMQEARQEVKQEVDEVISYVDRNFNFGLKGGLNFSTFNDAEVINSDVQTQFHIGLYGRFNFTRRLSAKAELLFSKKGTRADEFAFFEDYSIDLDYISLPIMAEFGITDNVSIELGPYFAVLVSSRQSFHELKNNAERFDVSQDETNFVDVGMGAGVTYTANNGLGIGVRYTQGFADALGKEFFRSASGANSVLQVSAYYEF